MRHVFLYNPAAGKAGAARAMANRIETYCKANSLDMQLVATQAPGDAERIARQWGERGEPVRLYVLGGDGTLSEAAAGAAGFENVALGVFPCGSGNDFVRSFAQDAAVFTDVAGQLAASAVTLDAIDCDGRLAVNVCSLGLDAQVAMHMAKYKRLPLVSGQMAYHLGVMRCMLGRLGCDLQIEIDGQTFAGRYLFALAANGRWYGGGYHCAPQASLTDGALDFILIRNPGRAGIARLVGRYRAGRHLSEPGFEKLVTFVRGQSMRVHALQETVANFDGEVRPVKEICFRALPGALHFLLPAGARLPERER